MDKLLKDFTQEEYTTVTRKACGSIRRNVEGKGYKYNSNIGEEAVQEALLNIWRNEKKAREWVEAHNLPLQAVINRKARQCYVDIIRRHEKYVNLTDNWQQGHESDRTQLHGLPDVNLSDIDFHVTLKQVLDADTYIVAQECLNGYTVREIAKRYHTTRSDVQRRRDTVKRFLIAGID